MGKRPLKTPAPQWAVGVQHAMGALLQYVTDLFCLLQMYFGWHNVLFCGVGAMLSPPLGTCLLLSLIAISMTFSRGKRRMRDVGSRLLVIALAMLYGRPF